MLRLWQFSLSDALSSVAYATEEILLVLVAAGSTALRYSIPIAAVIMLLLGIVILSYSQTIKAYPNGGGSYIVARENLGLLPGLVAGGSLMIDYILTVTVSVSARHCCADIDGAQLERAYSHTMSVLHVPNHGGKSAGS